MSDLKFELNYAGVGELLKCDALCEGMQSIGSGVAARAGDGYEADTQIGKKRAHTFVKPTTKQAYYDNLKNNTLLKALQS